MARGKNRKPAVSRKGKTSANSKLKKQTRVTKSKKERVPPPPDSDDCSISDLSGPLSDPSVNVDDEKDIVEDADQSDTSKEDEEEEEEEEDEDEEEANHEIPTKVPSPVGRRSSRRSVPSKCYVENESSGDEVGESDAEEENDSPKPKAKQRVKVAKRKGKKALEDTAKITPNSFRTNSRTTKKARTGQARTPLREIRQSSPPSSLKKITSDRWIDNTEDWRSFGALDY